MLKIKQTWLAAAVISSLLITACEHNPPVKTISPASLQSAEVIGRTVINKSPNDDRAYAALLLPNQLQVVLVSDPALENSAAALAVGVGSAQDPESQPGLAHYLEHMLFLGTQKYPTPDNFMEFVQANAGETNAFTAFDKTNFHFDINAGKFDEALDRFSDYFKAPTLDPQFADKERNAVNAEWSMNRSQDGMILHELDGVTANPANPRAHFNIGNLDTLSDKKDSKLQAEVKAFYGRYYSANNMRLTLVGKQSIPELKALAEKYFAAIPNKNIERPKISSPGLTSAQMGKSIHYQSRRDMKRLYVDFPILNNKNKWAVKPNEFLNNLLTSEEEGTLCEQLRKAGLANNVTAYIQPDVYGTDGYVRIYADLTDFGLKNTDRIIAAVFAYVDVVKQKGVNELYFRELKAMKQKDFINAPKVSPEDQAIELSSLQFELPLEHLLDADFVYDHFDAQAINELLTQLQPERARIWTISNTEDADKTIPYFEGKYSIRDITPAERSRWAALQQNLVFNLPPQNNLFTDKPADIVKNIFLKPHQVVSQAGVEAYLVQPEFYREDKGALSVEINTTFSQKTAKNVVLSNILSDIYKDSNTTLADRASRASLELTLHPSETNSQGIYINGYTTKHVELLTQLLKSYASLDIHEKEFNEALDRYKQSKINAKKAPPFKQAINHTLRLLRKEQWTDEALLLAANKITISDVIAYHKAVKADPFIRIFAFGNYDEATIQQMADVARQQFPGKRLPAQRSVQEYITPKAGQFVGYSATVEQTDSALVDVYIGDKKSDDVKAQLVILNSIYQNIFFNQLRTNEQLGYVVSSTPILADEYCGFAMYVQSANKDVAGIKARMDKFRSEFLAQLKAVDPAVIEQSKKAEAASIVQKPTDFYAESHRYSTDFWMAHYSFDRRERYLAALERVNKDNLIALYQKMLLNKQSMNMLIQLKGTAFADKPYAKP